jgi:regulatory protein
MQAPPRKPDVSGGPFRITSIETQKHDKSRVNIYLDGVFAFGLPRDVVVHQHLSEGDEISEDLIANVLLLDELSRAKEKALAYLSYRSRSIQELGAKLKTKGFSERTIQRVVEDFVRVGLLDDRAFAAAYVQTRMIQRPMSKRLLKKELFLKGISEIMASPAIEEVYEDRTELDVAASLAERRFSGKVDLNEQKTRKKISDFLARRGFSWEVISEVLRKINSK